MVSEEEGASPVRESNVAVVWWRRLTMVEGAGTVDIEVAGLGPLEVIDIAA